MTIQGIFTVLITLICMTDYACADNNFSFSDSDQRSSYSLGNLIAKEIQRKNYSLNEPTFRKGLLDSQNQNTPLLTSQQMDLLIAGLKTEIRRKMGLEITHSVLNRSTINRNRKRSGEAFMLANKHRGDVISLASGVQYRIISKGSGTSPTADNSVTLEYQARTLEGSRITGSGKKGESATYQINSLIKGLAEVLLIMQPGARWEVYIPPELAYGHVRRYAHQTVIVEVNLISIN